MNNENIEIATPKELIKNITKTNTKDDYQQYDNFFTNIDFDKHRRLYKDLGNDNFYDKLRELFNSKIYLFWKNKYKFQKELLFKIAENNKKTFGDIQTWNNYFDQQYKKQWKLLNSLYIKEDKKWCYLCKELQNSLHSFFNQIYSYFSIYLKEKSKIENFEKIYLKENEFQKLLSFIQFISIVPFFGKKYIDYLYKKNKDKIWNNLSYFIEDDFYNWLLEIIFWKSKQCLEIEFNNWIKDYETYHNDYFNLWKNIGKLTISNISFLQILSLKIKFLENPTTDFLNIFHYIFHYILEKWDYSEKQNILNILKKIIHIDYEYIKTNSYWDEKLIEKNYKDRIYWLLKLDIVNDFELAIDFLVETLKIDTDFIDIYEIISIINEWNQDKTNWLLKLFSAIIQKDYDFFKDNFLKHFYKLKITKNSEDIIKLVEISSKKSIDDAFDMIFGSETWFTEEKEKISIFIKEYSSWSCLLSWYRWVWKSTLIKSLIERLNKNSENNTNYIPITINIPEQKKDENWGIKTFSKKDLMNKIIQQTYLELKDKWFSSKQLENLQEQYIRTFKQVEEISWYVKLTKRFWLIRTVIEVLKFSIPILSSVFIWYLVNYFSKEIWNIATKFNISQDFTQSILSWFDIWYLQLLIAWILILLNYLIFRTIFNVNYNAKLERVLYNEDIAEDNFTKNLNNLWQEVWIFSKILVIFKDLIYIIYRFFPLLIEIASFPFRKIDKKFIIIIDELDKLLDFDKINKNEDKEKVSSMKDIFEILGKLKTLFFEAENILFFVVSNKEAYDYYLSNKFQEDDMISNIFNKIIYLPMNDMNQFNLNFKVDIKPKLDNALKEKIKKYLYFKSHWNWRKSNFILWNAIENTYKVWNQEIVRVNLWDYSSFINEYKFYEFFDNLYQVFEKWSLDYYFKQFREKSLTLEIAFQKFEEWTLRLNSNLIIYIIKLLKVKLNQIDKKIDQSGEKDFYSSYLISIKNLINELFPNEPLNINDYINFYINNEYNSEIEFLWYYAYSVNKISNNKAYRDFVLNYLLNIYESINSFKIINFQEILKNIKINEKDLEYPIFIDLIIFWLPLMLIYFNNIEIWSKNE